MDYKPSPPESQPGSKEQEPPYLQYPPTRTIVQKYSWRLGLAYFVFYVVFMQTPRMLKIWIGRDLAGNEADVEQEMRELVAQLWGYVYGTVILVVIWGLVWWFEGRRRR